MNSLYFKLDAARRLELDSDRRPIASLITIVLSENFRLIDLTVAEVDTISRYYFNEMDLDKLYTIFK